VGNGPFTGARSKTDSEKSSSTLRSKNQEGKRRVFGIATAIEKRRI